MGIITPLRVIYRRFIRAPRLDRAIYACLDALTDMASALRGYSFPPNYIRRWKLDLLRNLYEKETVALFQTIIKPGMTVVDIGAHIGYFTRIFSALVGLSGRVYAFEADGENFKLLQKNTRRLQNVRAIELAITDRSGPIDFYHYDDKAGLHSILHNVPLEYAKRKITVAADQLDAWLARENIARVDVIKMDIEGGEAAALRGMRATLEKPAPLALVTEFAPRWIEAAGVEPLQFLQKLTDLGFTLHAITPAGLVPLAPTNPQSYQVVLPKTPTAFNEFVNIYCVKKS